MLTGVQKVYYGIHMNNKQAVQAIVVHKIEDHMAAKGIKRKDLKESLDWSYERFRKRMECKIPFDIDELWTIAKVLRVNPLDLLPIEEIESAVAA